MERRRKIIAQIQAVIEDNLLVVVVGWKPSNHNAFTRQLPSSKIRFFFRLPRKLPQRTGIVLFTRFVSHKETELAGKMAKASNSILPLGEIRRILNAVFGPTVRQESKKEEVRVIPEKKPEQVSARVVKLEEATALRANLFVNFARMFLEAVGNDPDKPLGKFRTGKLIREAFGKDIPPNIAQQLVRDGWLEAIVQEGKTKTGFYKAGPKMLEAHTKPEPTDPIERAKWIIAHEADLMARKQKLEMELARLQREIAKVTEAKELLERLQRLMEE